jgi:hypothetical protein
MNEPCIMCSERGHNSYGNYCSKDCRDKHYKLFQKTAKNYIEFMGLPASTRNTNAFMAIVTKRYEDGVENLC